MIHYAGRSNPKAVCGASTATEAFTRLDDCVTCWRCQVQLLFIDSI